jgi:hypothetical protein
MWPVLADSQIHGTLVIIAVGKDGIMMAADSRSNFGPDGAKPLLFFDSTEKISRLKNYGVAIVGLAATIKVDLADQFQKFESTTQENKDLPELITNFYRYLLNSIPTVDFLAFRETWLLFAGYDNGNPQIIATKINDNGTSYKSHIILDSVVSDNDASKYFKYKAHLTCKHLGVLAEQAIGKYAFDTKQTNAIGGPISILQVKPSTNSVFLQNDFTNHIHTQWDFIKRYRKKNIKMHLLQPHAIKIADSIIRINYPAAGTP